MWRGGLFALVLAGLQPAPAVAQDTAQARLEVTLVADSAPEGSRTPVVRARNLLGDSPWLAALRQGLPVRLLYRLEVWRSRDAWFDVLERQYEWNLLIQHEPLLDQYTVVRLQGRQRTERRLATTGALAEVLGQGYRLVHTWPTEPGSYYYQVSLEVSTLSESDLDELERFFRGELQAGDDTSRSGSLLGRSTRRLVLKLAGLPTLRLSARSETFQVR